MRKFLMSVVLSCAVVLPLVSSAHADPYTEKRREAAQELRENQQQQMDAQQRGDLERSRQETEEVKVSHDKLRFYSDPRNIEAAENPNLTSPAVEQVVENIVR